MQTLNNSRERTFGYLTAVKSPEHGYFGGFLIISTLGRPLEFHCTAPIRPSRAQEILYGPTLQPYLLGEQICGALLAKVKVVPVLILTDCTAALQARSVAATPIIYVTGKNGASAASISQNQTSPQSIQDHYEIVSAPGFEAERNTVIETLSQLAKHVELMEPFNRIHEAICEAQRIGGRGASAHEQAA